MSLCIGIDFDNTIACYDDVFNNVAVEQCLIGNSIAQTKLDVKSSILAKPGGDISWQKLQGQIYGKYMHRAAVFPGFAEFIMLAKLRHLPVFIVSHKSELGHFDEEKIPLRDEAMKWLIFNKFVGDDSQSLGKNEVFFESTREEKIQRITELKCTHFIDDLPEVFDEPSFPSGTSKYLFAPQDKTTVAGVSFTGRSWRAISQNLLGEWAPEEIAKAVNALFPELDVAKAIRWQGRGNSKVYQLMLKNGSRCALKIYPDRQIDSRNRLETEFLTCSLLEQAGMPAMRAIAMDANMNWGVYSWIDGKVVGTPDDAFIDTSLGFVAALKNLGNSPDFQQLPLASEACLSAAEIVRQVRHRLNRFSDIEEKSLHSFLKDDFLPLLNLAEIKSEENELYKTDLPPGFLVASPSDFGAHNAIRNTSDEIVFIDFEYFGWDDPVKLVADFYWHPAMELSPLLKERWITGGKKIFSDDPAFSQRLADCLPLFGLRWCLILLNEFLPARMAQRIHADGDKRTVVIATQQKQLAKAKEMLANVKKISL